MTRTQINFSKLGQVPSARVADSAKSASTAKSATTATAAKTAVTAAAATLAANATALAGQPASAYERSSNWVRSGFVTATPLMTANLASFGPFKLMLYCAPGSLNANLQSTNQASIEAATTEDNSDVGGRTLIAQNGWYGVLAAPDAPSVGTLTEVHDSLDLIAPDGQAFVALLTVGENFPGKVPACFATALVTPS